MMTPEQIQALHATDDFLAETMGKLRTYQSKVTHMLATANQDQAAEGSDQEQLSRLFSLREIPYATLPYEGSTRVDMAITTEFEGATHEDDVINIEFQFDAGKMIGLRTLMGKRV